MTFPVRTSVITMSPDFPLEKILGVIFSPAAPRVESVSAPPLNREIDPRIQKVMANRFRNFIPPGWQSQKRTNSSDGSFRSS